MDYKKFKIKIATLDQILFGKLLYIRDIQELKEREILELNDVIDFIVTLKNNYDYVNIEKLRNKAKEADLIDTFEILLDLMMKSND